MKRVLVVGGSEEFVGAAYLASIAALRAGAESVIVMTPQKVAWALNCLSPDLMTKKLRGSHLSTKHRKEIEMQLKTADILLLGNGATTRPQTARLLQVLMKWPGQKVIDADAVKVLRGNAVKNAIITPNKKEWELLFQNADIEKLLMHNVIVRKGSQTEILYHSKKVVLKPNLGLERAGNGDVLAGLCAGFLAQGLSLFDAAKKATAVGNEIANILTKKKKGYYFLASDIVNELPKVRF